MRSFFSVYKYQIALCLIVATALFLRIVDLENTPSGFHADEASFLVNAQSLSDTWRDEDGRLLPLSLHSFIDPKPALYSYFQIPFIQLFGVGIFAARMPAVIAGTVSVWLVYVLMQKISGHQMLALIVAVLMAISPWHILASRVTQEVIFSSMFALAAAIFVYDYLKTGMEKYLVPLAVFSFFAMYMYHSTKLFLLLLIIFWSGFYFLSKKISIKKASLIIGIALAVLIASLIVQESSSRFAAVGFLNNPETQLVIDDYTRKATGELPDILIRVFYNKPIFYSHALFSQYVTHFSPQFLFLEGGEPLRYFIPHHGLLFWIELPLLLLGMGMVLIKRKSTAALMFSWLLLSPVAAALTFQETPSVIRAFLLIIPLLYFIAEGIIWLLQLPKRPVIFVLCLMIIGYIWSISYFWVQFSVQQAVVTPWYRNNPYSDIAAEVSDLEADYQRVVVTNDLRPLYTYFVLEQLIRVEQLQENSRARDLEEYRLGKFVFNRGVCDFGNPDSNTLYVAEFECRMKLNYPAELHVVKTISYGDGLPVYELLEYKE